MLTPTAPAPHSSGRWIAVVVAGVLVIAGSVIAAVLLRGGNQPPQAEVIVTLEAVGDVGPDPFTGTKGVGPVKSISNRVESVATGSARSMTRDEKTGTLTISGTSDNLYGGETATSNELFGGSGKLGECDVPELASFLAANPDKAKAWATVRNILPEQIPGYLQSLTPVVLLQDTLVTNHGFSNGVATPRQAVLQAGTGVLVDSTGQPVVRCACGNPLSAPAPISLSTAKVQGTPWDGYDPAQTVVVTGGAAVNQFVLVDVATAQSYTEPAGAAQAAPTVAAPTTTSSVPVSSVPVSSLPVSSEPASSSPAADPAADCSFELDALFGSGPAWAAPEQAGNDFTCADMVARWQAYEQWPGDRGGTLGIVDFPDGSYCTVVHYRPDVPETNVVGDCDVAGRRFAVHRGEYAQQSGVAANPLTRSADRTAEAVASTAAGAALPVVSQDSLITPSNNIVCAILDDGNFHCHIVDYDFPLAPCENERAPVVTLMPTGQPTISPCIGDSFVRVTSPTPTPYGTVVALGQISCDVEETGLRCVNPEGHGFALSRAAFTPF